MNNQKLTSRRLVGLFSVLAGVLMILSLFRVYPEIFQKTITGLLIIFPLIAVILFYCFRDSTGFFYRKKEAGIFSSVFITFFLPSIALALDALWINILDWSHFFKPFFIVSILLSVLVMWIYLKSRPKSVLFNRRRNNFSIKVTNLLGIIFICLLYGFGSVMAVNVFLDKSDCKIFRTSIIKKERHGGRKRLYYLKLAPWEEVKEIPKARIEAGKYLSKYKERDQIFVIVREGRLGIPWFTIEK